MTETTWPEWFKGFRPHQEQALTEIKEAFDSGAKAVFVDAPTGSGKSVIGEATRKILGTQGMYLCSDKTLQEQFARDFPYASVLKGRKNYPTIDYPEDFPKITCEDCTKTKDDNESCEWCPSVEECMYEMAKERALRSELAVLNSTYFLIEANFIGRFSKRKFAIMDECDMMERELMRHVEFGMYPATFKMLGLDVPKKGIHKETISKWLDYELKYAIKRVTPGHSSKWGIKKTKSLERLAAKAKWMTGELDSDNWVRHNGAGPLVLKPVSVGEFGQDKIWRHAEKWLCMSATIVSADQMAEDLGLEDKFEVVRVPMTFPVKNRPIYALNGPQMTAANKEDAWPEMARAIEAILERHPHERVLVHTVSYELARYLMECIEVPRDVITYQKADEREEALAKYRATPGAVLLASSMDRGVDLVDEDCRVVIVAKVPYPYLGDPQIAQRMHKQGGQNWYNVQTVRSLIQMTGRGVRHDEDTCVTYIADGKFLHGVWKDSKHLFPQWWKDAVSFSFPYRELSRDKEK